MHIEWGPKYAVGIGIIDQQHKETIRLFNALDDVAAAGGPEEAIRRVVEEIRKHLYFHINTEERFFDQFNYEHADVHKAAHRSLLVGYEQVTALYATEPKRVCDGLIPVMREWLELHTAIHDRQYVDCFLRNGLT